MEIFPTWLPDKVKVAIGDAAFLEQEDYLPLKRLLTDDTVMPNVWNLLDKKGKAIEFYMKRLNAISFWMMADTMPLTEQKKHLLKAEKALHALYANIIPCAENQFFMQHCFENAMREYFHPQRVPFNIIGQNNPERLSVHFISLLGKILNHFDEQKKYLLERQHQKDSNFPRKMNDKNAFRTYLVKGVSKDVKEFLGAKNYALVADIVQVMTDDSEGIGEDLISKIVNS